MSRLRANVNAVYAADLLGAGAGCLLLMPALNILGAPGAIVTSAFLGGGAAIVFADSPAYRRRVIGVGVVIVLYFVQGFAAGWASLVVLIVSCTGAILTSLGVLGIYVGKIFEQVRGRPLYIIRPIGSFAAAATVGRYGQGTSKLARPQRVRGVNWGEVAHRQIGAEGAEQNDLRHERHAVTEVEIQRGDRAESGVRHEPQQGCLEDGTLPFFPGSESADDTDDRE